MGIQVDALKAKLATQEVELQKKNEEADKLIRIVEAETAKVSLFHHLHLYNYFCVYWNSCHIFYMRGQDKGVGKLEETKTNDDAAGRCPKRTRWPTKRSDVLPSSRQKWPSEGKSAKKTW